MKHSFLFCIGITLLISSCSRYQQDLRITNCTLQENRDTGYTKAAEVQQAMEELVKSGVPGAAIAIYTNGKFWTTATGFAKLEDQTPMQPCHLQYLQSISKTYMAVAVLKLYEQGKIDLDAPITQYLPAKYSNAITDAGKITVRMLLNHTSGIPEYNFAPAYVTYLLQHPDHLFTPEDYIGYIKHKPLDFAPGSRYAYRNTNYVLLALLTDALTGNHAALIAETIFKPLKLTNTFYRNDGGYLTYANLVNSYWDRNSNGVVENASQLQRTNVSTLIGDDGIVTTPVEAVRFLKGLLEGKLLADTTLKQMQNWVHDSKGKPRYGLGLTYTTINGHIAYGHSGGGIGAGCELYYFPDKDVYMFIAINLGTVTDSPLHQKLADAREKLYAALLR